jgi:hypothetical protein
MVKQRRRFKQQLTLKDRLGAWASTVRAQAEKLPPASILWCMAMSAALLIVILT